MGKKEKPKALTKDEKAWLKAFKRTLKKEPDTLTLPELERGLALLTQESNRLLYNGRYLLAAIIAVNLLNITIIGLRLAGMLN